MSLIFYIFAIIAPANVKPPKSFIVGPVVTIPPKAINFSPDEIFFYLLIIVVILLYFGFKQIQTGRRKVNND